MVRFTDCFAYFILTLASIEFIFVNSDELSKKSSSINPNPENVLSENVHGYSVWKERDNSNNDDYLNRGIPSLDDVLVANSIVEDGEMNQQEEVKRNSVDFSNADKNIRGLEDVFIDNIQGGNDINSDANVTAFKPEAESVTEANENFDKELIELRSRIMSKLPELIKEGVRNAEKILDMQKANENATSPYIPPSRKVDPETKRISECTGLSSVETMKLIVERFHLPTNKIGHILESISIKPYKKDLRTKYCNSSMERTISLRMPCDPNYEYRTITGMCNNLQNPNKGASNTPFSRFQPPEYGDGFNSLRGEGLSPALPNPRRVSYSLKTPRNPTPDIHMSQMLKAWGQIVDHDLTFSPESHVGGCCDDGTLSSIINSEFCRPIIVTGDPFFSNFNIECLRFTRSLPATSSFGQREQMNALTAFLDGSQVYGSTDERAFQLRSFVNGKLKENVIGEDGQCSGTSHCQMPLLPENPGSSESNFFGAGDHRVNEQPGLTAMHTMLFRLHNHLAAKLKAKHGEYNDEKIYQEARRIVGAVIQQITFNEFLPLLVGKKYMRDFGLYSGTSGYFQDYDSSVDPAIRNAFSAAALRIGHTFITGFIRGKEVVNLATVFHRSAFVKRNKNMFPSYILKGECENPSERYDVKLIDAITDKLNALPPFHHGTDLMSLNIQRARDHGIPPYNKWRSFCGRTPFASFEDMKKEMLPEVVNTFQSLYSSVDDIDLFPAAIAEFRTSHGFIGDTLSCLLSRQFQAIKYGDRFWYEGTSQPKPFTVDQLQAIRSTSLASVVCVTTTNTKIQPFPMLMSTLRRNGERECSTYLPGTVMESIDQFW